VRSYRTLSPLPRKRGGLLSVALSLGSPPPDVIRRRVSVEPGLSSAREARRPSGLTIPLGRPLPAASCDQPGRRPGDGMKAHRLLSPLFGLAPGGACRASRVAAWAVRSYRTLSPLPRWTRRFAFCGAFPGVAPAGRYPAPCLRGARTFLCREAAAIRPAGG